jgi:hypothetical protein
MKMFAFIAAVYGTGMLVTAVFVLWSGIPFDPRRIAVVIVIAWSLMIPFVFREVIRNEKA